MSTTAEATIPPFALRPRQIAPAWHTVVLILLILAPLLQAASSFSPAAAPAHAVPFYLSGLVFLWLLFAYAWWGLRMRKVSLPEVIGRRALALKDIPRDLLLAAVFWVVWYGALSALKQLLILAGLTNRVTSGMVYPNGTGQIALWILCSVSAGFVEEFVFRGYLIRQFAAWTRNKVAAVLLQAILFGISHAFYLGVRQVMLITLSGLLIGALTVWRRSLPPAMIFHTWADIFGAAVVRGLPFE